MERKVEYQVSYDVRSTIEYVGGTTEHVGEKKIIEHYFKLTKEQPDNLWESGVDRAVVYLEDGEVFDIVGVSCILKDEEITAIEEMMLDILAKK